VIECLKRVALLFDNEQEYPTKKYRPAKRSEASGMW
jgi:hypothetical protein